VIVPTSRVLVPPPARPPYERLAPPLALQELVPPPFALRELWRARTAPAARPTGDQARSHRGGSCFFVWGRKGPDSSEYGGGGLGIVGRLEQAGRMLGGIGAHFHLRIPRPSKQQNWRYPLLMPNPGLSTNVQMGTYTYNSTFTEERP
jgi:hypothetical protein